MEAEEPEEMRDELGEYAIGPYPENRKVYYKRVNLHLSPEACAVRSHWCQEARIIADRQRHGRERTIKTKDSRHYREFTHNIKRELEERLSDYGLSVYFEDWLRLKGFIVDYKVIHIKIIVQGKTQRHTFRAPAGKFYNLEQIEINRGSVIEWLDVRFPHFDFREVQIAPNAFNYIATGVRPGSAPILSETAE